MITDKIIKIYSLPIKTYKLLQYIVNFAQKPKVDNLKILKKKKCIKKAPKMRKEKKRNIKQKS